MTEPFQRVAIVDDDSGDVEMLSVLVEDMEAEPVPVLRNDAFQDLQSASDWLVDAGVDALVCDHHLSRGGYAKFDGASLCARMYSVGKPFVLISTFVEQDIDVSIRRWRRSIPCVLDKTDPDPQGLRASIETCANELNGIVLPERKPRRVLIQVLRQPTTEGRDDVIDASIPVWRPNFAVRFPISLVPENLRVNLEPGSWWLADVNVGAPDSRDLFIDRIEFAPEPLEDEFF